MTELNQIYKCHICGMMVEITHAGGGVLICDGQPMQLMAAGAEDTASEEKHVPVIEKTPTGYLVKVGSVPHPMEAEHHIEWIELLVDNQVYRRHLTLDDNPPQAEFAVAGGSKVVAREYCNLHGLWMARE
ncbi:desulfoferrodoxin [Microgenomates group bacterium]|nr:desulfoferrodoxin [Microgenomates group bacterium]